MLKFVQYLPLDDEIFNKHIANYLKINSFKSKFKNIEKH